MKTKRTMAQSLTRILIVTGVVLAIPLVANQFTGGGGWSLFDFALAGGLVMGTGLLYELAVGRPGSRTSAVVAAIVAAVGGAAVVLGEFDDAPGLVLLGFLLVLTAVAIGIRGARPGVAPEGHAGGTGRV